jgi:hypothetical protein
MGGVRDVFWEKYFWGLVWPDGTDEIKKASTYICTEMGVPETCFLRNIFGGRGFRPKIALERIGSLFGTSSTRTRSSQTKNGPEE